MAVIKSRYFKTVLPLSVLLALYSYSYAHGEKQHESEPETFDAVTTEFGRYTPELEPSQSIDISMADTMRFTPSDLKINKGDVVKFVVSNDGALLHEFVLGTAPSLIEHAALMVKFPNMEHEEAYMAHVDSGESMEIIWQFTESGSFEFGCLLPGHFEAGMKGTITVQ